MLNKIREFVNTHSKKQVLGIIAVLCILAILPAIVIVSGQQTNYRQHAAEPSPSLIVNIQQQALPKDADQAELLTSQLLQLNKSSISTEALSVKDQTTTDQTTARLTEIARKRKGLLLQVLEKDPRIFLTIAMKKTMQSSMPSIIQDYLEKEVTVEGKIEVLHIDDFKNPENSKFSYFLKTDNQKLTFYPTQELSIRSGAKIRVKGIRLDNKIAVNTDRSSVQILEEAPKPESVGDQKTLILLVLPEGEGDAPFTKEKANDLIFNGQFQKFYKEQSYNQVSFSGDVLGWFTVSSTCSCNNLTDPEIQKIILENNIHLENYDRSVILLKRFAATGMSTVGKIDIVVNDKAYHISDAFVGVDFNQSADGNHPFEWKSSDRALSHEVGHSLGTLHANGWDCGDQILYGECTYIEYGNYFDTMGDGTNSLHFNAFYKELLGWMNPSSSLLINSSGAYTINPLELDSDKKFAKIQLKDSSLTPFYLEYRKGIGFDANLNKDTLLSNKAGIFVNLVGEDPTWDSSSPRLLDMNPTSKDWYHDMGRVTLNGKNIFTDLGRGITIGPITKTDKSSITFDVKLADPTCIRKEPLANTVYSSESVAAGGQGNVGIDVTNTDYFGCRESEFEVVPTLPLKWEYDHQENIIVDPEKKGFTTLNFYVPEDASTGNYSLSYDILNVKSGLKAHKDFTVTVKSAVKISRIDPKIGNIGTNITIYGSYFDKTASNNNVRFYNLEGFVSATSELFQIGGEQALKFIVPETICAYDGGGKGAPSILGGGGGGGDPCLKIKTALGIYGIDVFNKGGSGFSNTVNFEVTEATTPTPTPLPTKLNLNLSLTGIGRKQGNIENNNPLNKTRQVTVYIDKTFSQTGTVTYDNTKGLFTGIVDFGNVLKTGSYIIKIKTNKYLLQQANPNNIALTFGITNIVSPITLLAGDVNNDDIIDKQDGLIISQCFGKKTASCINSSDLNDDGKVDQIDYNLFARNFSKK